MNVVFYISSVIAVIATAMVVTRANVVHALLYLIVSLLAVALIFFVLGAPFVAALEVLIYAGAIMVLFVFVIMMLNLGARGEAHQKALLSAAIWIGPGILAIVLLGELIYVLVGQELPRTSGGEVSPKEVSLALFGPYVLGVELASVLLLAGLVGAYHLGRRVARPRKEGP
jgi:NADH-quinone oxidoreductase subunit J